MSDTIRWVRITSVPAGEAPLWVREAWVGVELPDFGETPGDERVGVLSHKKVRGGPHDFVVDTETAIDTLRQKSPKAAHWWEVHCPFSNKFVFNRTEVTVIPSPPLTSSSSEIRELSPEE